MLPQKSIFQTLSQEVETDNYAGIQNGISKNISLKKTWLDAVYGLYIGSKSKLRDRLSSQ